MVDLSRFPRRTDAPPPRNRSQEIIEADLRREAGAAVLDDADPASVLHARRLGRELNVSPSLIEADPQGFEHVSRQEQVRRATEGDAWFAKWMSDTRNAVAAKDDIEPLSNVSRMLGGTSEDASLGVRIKSNNLGETAIGSPMLRALGLDRRRPVDYRRGSDVPIEELASSARGRAMGRQLDIEEDRPDVTPGNPLPVLKGWGVGALVHLGQATLGAEQYIFDSLGLGDRVEGTISGYSKRLSETEERNTPRLNRVGTGLYAGGQSIVDMLVLRGLGASTKVSMLTSMGAEVGLGSYEELRARGGTANEALLGGVGTGAIEVLTEAIPTGWLFNAFGKKGGQGFVKGFLLPELLGEQLATLGQDAIDTAIANPDKTWDEYWAERPEAALQTALATGTMLGTLGAGNVILRRLSGERREIEEADRGIADARMLDELMSESERSSMRKADPESFREFVEARTENTPLRDIYVPVEAVSEYMQSEGYEPGFFERYQEQIAEAQATKGDVVIPIADAAAHLAGTPAWEKLKDRVRVTPGGMSRKEATERSAAILEGLEERGKEIARDVAADGEAASAAAEVFVEVKNQLFSIGRDSKEAEHVAQLYAASREAWGKRLGMSALEYHRANPVAFEDAATGARAGGRTFEEDGDTLVVQAEKAPYGVQKFWEKQAEQGRTPPAVWAMRSLGEVQPIGYVQGWSINKNAVEKMVKETKGKWEIVKMLPPSGGRTFEQTDPRILYQSTFYSALQKAVDDSNTKKASAAQWIATLRRAPGVKQEELEWTGLLDFLNMQEGPIAKTQLQELLEAGGIQVDEIELSEQEADPGLISILTEQRYEQAIEDMIEDGVEEDKAKEIADENWGDYQLAAEKQADELEEDRTQFSQWSSDPSNDTYRELLITLPLGEGNNPQRAPSTHWDHESVVAHARFMEKQDAEGKRVLFIEEVQSDWHQKGRDEGYARPASAEQIAAAERAAGEARKEFDEAADRARPFAVAAMEAAGYTGSAIDRVRTGPSFDVHARLSENVNALPEGRKRQLALAAMDATREADLRFNEASQALNRARSPSGIPDAPFKSSWPALVLKRMIRYASDRGFEKIAWTTGIEQAERYSLGQHVGELEVQKMNDGRYRVRPAPDRVRVAEMIVEQGQGEFVSTRPGTEAVAMSSKQVHAVFGNDVGGKLIDTAEKARGASELFDTTNMRIGDEGMKAFYDRNLVNIANDIVKKYGVKVGPIAVTPSGRDLMTGKVNATPHPGFDITPQLADAARGGFPLFQGNRGSASFFEDGSTVVRLFATANRSTLLHETGHVWLEELRRNAEREGAPADVVEDWNKVQAWFKANRHPLKEGVIPVEAHELFARGAERYFMEGKAPSAELQGAFTAFRAWLLRIYQVVLNLRSPITPEIREVFDRMLATQEAIDTFREQQNVKPLFKSAQEAEMTEAEFAAYNVSVAGARDEAYNALLFKTMEAIRRREQARMREQRSNVKADVAAEINKKPEFIALHLLRTGRWLGDPEREPMKVKLNTGWLIDTFGEDILGRLPHGAIHKGDGLDGDQVAEIVGMASGQQLVETLVLLREATDQLRASGETRSVRDKMIDDETDRIMAERHGDAMTDGSIEEEAIAALNTAAQGEIIAGEIRQLGKRKSVLGEPTPYRIAREWAKRTIQAGRVRDVASRQAMQRYTRAATKAARQAENAMLKGEVDEAFRQKQAQLLNHALLAESKVAADQIDIIVARMNRLAKRAAMKSVDQDYMDRVHMLLERYDFRPRSQKAVDEYEGFAAWIKDQREKGFEVHVPPRLEARGEHYSRVTVEELSGLNDLVQSLLHLGRTKQKMRDAQGEREFSEFRDEVTARIERLPTRKTTRLKLWVDGRLLARETIAPNDERERVGAGLASELLKIETIVEELDGGPTGPLHDLIIAGATRAANERDELRDRVLIPIARTYHALDRKQWKRLQERVTIPELTWNTVNEGDPRHGSPVTITRSELLEVFMNMGNLSNLEKLSKGERWPVPTLRAVIDREFVKSDYDLAQTLWNQVGELWPDIVRVERALSGVVPEQVVPTPIETRFGTYEGGYWPVVYDSTRSQRAEDHQGAALDDMFGLKSGVATQKGHTITRTDAVGPFSLSLEQVLFGHIEQVITRIAYAEYARDVLRAIKDRRIKGLIDTKLGREYRKQIEPWIARQIHEGAVNAKAAKWWEKVLRQTRINMTIAAMGFRFSTGAAQTLGLTASAQRIGARWVAQGVKQLLLNPAAGARFVDERSPEMMRRREAVNRDVAEVFARLRGKHTVLARAQAWAFWHIGMIDRYMVSIPTWLGAHARGMSKGMTDAEAAAYADKSVRLSQGAGREKDLSRIQSPNNDAMRFFTMFYTPFNVMFNAQWQGVRGLKRGDPRPAIGVAFWWMTASMLADALLSGDWPDDDAESWLGWFGRNVFFGAFAGLPLIRDYANYKERKISGEYATLGTPPEQIMDAVDKAIQRSSQAYEGDEIKKPIKDAGQIGAVLFGIPTGQAGTTAQYLWDYRQGETDPQTISDWYFGLTRGREPASED